MTMTCNLSLSTERPAGHKPTAEIQLVIAEIPSLKVVLMKHVKMGDEGEQFVRERWQNQSCDQMVVPSGISLSNCQAHVNIFAHAHLVVHVGVFFFIALLFLATFGRHWWHWCNTSCVTHNSACTESAHFFPTFSTRIVEKNQLYLFKYDLFFAFLLQWEFCINFAMCASAISSIGIIVDPWFV